MRIKLHKLDGFEKADCELGRIEHTSPTLPGSLNKGEAAHSSNAPSLSMSAAKSAIGPTKARHSTHPTSIWPSARVSRDAGEDETALHHVLMPRVISADGQPLWPQKVHSGSPPPP